MDPLHAYLNDHLGGSTTGRDLARTLAEHRTGTPSGPRMERVSHEIDEDVQLVPAHRPHHEVAHRPIMPVPGT